MKEIGRGGLAGPLTGRERGELAREARKRTYREEYGKEISKKPASDVDMDLGTALAFGDFDTALSILESRGKKKK